SQEEARGPGRRCACRRIAHELRVMAILLAAPEGRRQRGPSCRNAIMLALPPRTTRWPSPGALPERRGDAHRTGGAERHQLRGARTPALTRDPGEASEHSDGDTTP